MKKLNTRLANFNKKIVGKKLIIFGTGPTAKELMGKLKLPISYLVDNDKNNWDQSIDGYKVFNPKKIKTEKKGEVVVVIASSAVEDIAEQLIKMGLKKENSFLTSPFLIDYNKQKEEKNLPKLLVTAFGESGGLWLIDLKEEKKKRILRGNCRGIEAFRDGYYVVLDNVGIVKLNKKLQEIKRYKLPHSQNLHSIALDKKRGIIYLNETGHDRIGIFNARSLKRTGEIYLGKNKKNVLEQHHINDVKIYNDQIYVSLFSLKGVWRREIWKDGAIVKINRQSGMIENKVVTGLSQPHSILFDNNQIYYCNSMNCEVKKGRTTICKIFGYTRGLAKKDDMIFIGQSKARRLSRFDKDFKIVSLDTGIHCWNVKERTDHFISLPADGIFEIKLI